MKSNIADPLDSQIAAVRGFSRFYTRKLGIIEPKLLDSPWTLQEARIIYEIADRQTCTATDLAYELGLDAGSSAGRCRTCSERQIVARKPSKADRRATELSTDRERPRGLCRTRQPVAQRRRHLAGETRRRMTAPRSSTP